MFQPTATSLGIGWGDGKNPLEGLVRSDVFRVASKGGGEVGYMGICGWWIWGEALDGMSCGGFFKAFFETLHSLKRTAKAPENSGRPKRKIGLSTIHFQV